MTYRSQYIGDWYFCLICIIIPCWIQNPLYTAFRERRNIFRAIFSKESVARSCRFANFTQLYFLRAINLLTELWGHWWPAYRYYSICSKTFDYSGHKRYIANLFMRMVTTYEVGLELNFQGVAKAKEGRASARAELL